MSISGKSLRKATIRARRTMLESPRTPTKDAERTDFSFTGSDDDLLDLSDVMVEQAVGYMALPLGLAGPIVIDGEEFMVPMATEEPSVIAAVTFAGHLVSRQGEITTAASEPVMVAQIFMENLSIPGESAVESVLSAQPEIRAQLKDLLESMERRGGGWRGLNARWIAPSRTLAVNILIDVRDAMGANLLNSAAEQIRPFLEKLTGGDVLMAILSNRSWDRTASARLRIPVDSLSRPGFSGEESARRIVKAARVAREDPDRGVTHNKGIMNGVSALAVATGNDTRAIEAAAHAYAGRYGPYHALSQFWLEGNDLHGSLEMPLPFAVTGGAVGFHPATRWGLEVLGWPDARRLSRIAAAVGLAQNLAALRALVSEGIQKGHMALHARRLSFDSGARGDDLERYARTIREEGIRARDAAASRYEEWRKENSTSGR